MALRAAPRTRPWSGFRRGLTSAFILRRAITNWRSEPPSRCYHQRVIETSLNSWVRDSFDLAPSQTAIFASVFPRLTVQLVAGLAAIACGAAPAPAPQGPTPKPPATATVSIPAAPGVSLSKPATWVLFPKSHHWAPAFQRFTEAGTLYAGPGNERWLAENSLRGAGPDAVALVGALPSGAGYAYITPTGEVYEAQSALGELQLTEAPPTAFVDAAAGRDHFFAIDASGTPQRSSDKGHTWQGVALPGHTGPFSDVVMLESGSGLLLANHAGDSKLFSTFDDGATWQPVDSQGYTFTGLVSQGLLLQPIVRVDEQHDFYVYATLDDMLSRVTGESRVFRSYTPFSYGVAPPALATFAGPPPESPGAGAARSLSWMALRATNPEDALWEFSLEPFGEPPRYRYIPQLKGCSSVSAAATRSEVAISCQGASAYASLFLSQDEGESFRELPLPPGVVLLHGLGDALVAQTPCDGLEKPRASFLLEPPAWRARRVIETTCRAHFAFTPAAEPGSFLSVAWADSRLTLHRWVVGDAKPTLVSVINAAAVAPDVPVALARQGAVVVVGVPTWYPVSATDGTVTTRRTMLFRSNDGGRHFAKIVPPAEFRMLALSGSRGLGITHDDVAYETDDFGTTWARVSAPAGAGHAAIECNGAGCITVRGLRMGWSR